MGCCRKTLDPPAPRGSPQEKTLPGRVPPSGRPGAASAEELAPPRSTSGDSLDDIVAKRDSWWQLWARA